MSTILVVEDELSIIEFLKDALEGEGYQVETANNGEEGLNCLTRASIDLILCDIMMPVMDGREMCRIIQSDPKYTHMPIILMSAVVTVMNDLTCQTAAFIKKPFNLNDLLDTIAQIASANSAN